MKSVYYAVWGILFVMLVTALLMAYWMFWPITVLEVKSTTILTPIVKRGEFLRYKLSYVKHYDIVGDVHRTLVNDRTVTLVSSESSKSNYGKCELEVTVLIPPNMWPGRYRLKVDIAYPVNPLRTINAQYYTDWFTIK